jgi:hypothetical protein
MSTHIDRCSIAFSRENCCTAVKLSGRASDQSGHGVQALLSFLRLGTFERHAGDALAAL